MAPPIDISILEPHARRLEALLPSRSAPEAAAYALFGMSSIGADPWHGAPRERFVSHRTVDIPIGDVISSSAVHVTWDTRSYMGLLHEAAREGLMPAIVHTHPGSGAFFSEQDDRNEFQLARTAALKGMPGLISIVLGGDGSMRGRLWRDEGTVRDAEFVQTVGASLRRHHLRAPGDGEVAHLDRQRRLFGEGFNPLVRSLKVAVVGCGGTGSPVAMLLARLGVGHLILVDGDVIEETNLNRVHGSRRADALEARAKVDVIAREIAAAGLGVEVATSRSWVNAEDLRDALRSCDFVFGCTDDHSGRIFLNRLAYFYGIPVIDVGVRMLPLDERSGHNIEGRVTTLAPEHPCLVCSGVVNPTRAYEEDLERRQPDEARRRKAEAYVAGSGDPAPAVVSFTTEMACVAVNEMVAALTRFRGGRGMVAARSRRFHAGDDRLRADRRRDGCPMCQSGRYLGACDVEPFLDVVG